MEIKLFKMKKILIIFTIFIICKSIYSAEAFFDLSEKEIQIQTDFKGKEILIFGIFKEDEDTIVTIKGPKKNTKVMKKERILGFWFNTKKIIFNELPSLFFLTSSSPVEQILSEETIIKQKLYFNALLINIVSQRNFIQNQNLDIWNEQLIEIQKNKGLFKESQFKKIDNKLFQARVFFPSNSLTGKYKVTIYQIKDKIILSKKNKYIYIKKSGIGEKVFKFANEEPAAYGLLAIFFAIISGLTAATLFRRL